MLSVCGFKISTKNSRIITKVFTSTTGELSTGRVSAAVVQSQEKKKSTEKLDLSPPKGTRDFYPEDHRLKSWLFGTWREVAAQFGFEEYDAPVVENEELYIRKAGEEVTQQLYNFEDKGGRRLSLRPEMTPSLARMVLARRQALPYPLKWFSIPQCWRYERMTRGRRREHYQWNMDIWGVAGVEAESELLAAIVFALKKLGVGPQDVGIKVNSRKLLLEIMTSIGIPDEKFASTCVLVDKLEKVPLESLSKELEEIGLQKETVQQLMDVLVGADLDRLEQRLGATSEGVSDLKKLFKLAASYGYADWLVFDPSVVRGLAYYTGIVFEGFDRKGVLRAIFGGGRYDALLTSFGGDPVPAVGFGFGDAVIVELLQEKGVLPDTSKPSTSVLIAPLTDDQREAAIAMASDLRNAGVTVDLLLEEKKVKWIFQRAEKFGTDVVVIVSKQQESGETRVEVKSLKAKSQVFVAKDEVVPTVQNLLDTKTTR